MSNIRVMIVEDEEDLREILITVLELEGVDCRAAIDGQDALEKLAQWKTENWKPQVIISDITMPRMNGFELLKNLIESNQIVPLIFMSGHADKELEQKAKELGAIGIQTKPFKGDEVLAQIKTIVGQ